MRLTAMREPELVADQAALEAVAARIARADRVAVDVEANGLFAYRANLCTIQLAVVEEGELSIWLCDALALDLSPLAEALGAEAPLKILHDLTFDAELLAASGVRLGRVRDTSIAARFLGHEATGLGNVLERVLGVTVDKSLQQHDWGARPLSPAALVYLASDVAHLIALDDRLTDLARTQDILEEIEEESTHRAKQAELRLADMQPAYTRIKNATTLPTWPERAILRRIHALRERLAEEADVPSHRIVPSEMLLLLCREKPRTAEAFRSIVERRRPGLEPVEWIVAIEQGIADGDVPEEDKVFLERPSMNPVLAERRKRREGQINAWRKAEALRRGVAEQAVLPGHVARSIATKLAEFHPDVESKRRALLDIPGVGEKRFTAYLESWLAIEDLA